MGFLQPGVLTSRGLTIMGSYKQGSYNQRFLKPGVLTRIGSYNKGSHNQGFLQPGVLQSGFLTTRGLTTRDSCK